MYLVKALAACSYPVTFDGPNVPWSSGQLRRVDDSVIERIRAHSTVFTIVAGPDEGAIEQAIADDLATDAPGTKNGSTVTADENQPVIHTTVLTCVATPIAITDDAGVAQYGGVKIYSFPEGLIEVFGAVIDGAVTLGDTGTITNTWAGGVALGTVEGTTGATLVSTEANILSENDVAAATLKVATVDAVSTVNSIHDGTGGAKDVYLNLVVDDSVTHTSGTGTFTGTVTLVWALIGDK